MNSSQHRRSALRQIRAASAIGLVALALPAASQAATTGAVASRDSGSAIHTVAHRTHHAARSTGRTSSAPKITTSGAIVAINRSSLSLQLVDGQSLTVAIPASAVRYFTSNDVMRLCETASVVYENGASGAVLTALTPTGITTSPEVSLGYNGNCATDSDGEDDLVGSVVALSPASVTLSLGGGSVSFPLAPGRDLQADENIGDLVDVTFDPAGDIAYNLETSELYTSGVITSVSNHSMTIRNAITGKSEQLPPDAAAYFGLKKGNTVGVVYYIDAGKPKADNISDLTTGVNN